MQNIEEIVDLEDLMDHNLLASKQYIFDYLKVILSLFVVAIHTDIVVDIRSSMIKNRVCFF